MKRLPNLVLIGFMATGKSTIGRRCAAALAYEFYDTDTWIEEKHGRPIREIFAQEGEARFREIEAESVSLLSGRAPIVLSTGGGVPLNPENVERLRENGIVALLQASPETILRRTGDRASRPLLASTADPLTRIEDLLTQRESAYRGAADFTVDSTNLSSESASGLVLRAYRERVPAFLKATGANGG